MDINDLISEERKIEIESEIEKELYDLKNNIITRSEFISYIDKKYSFIEVYYIITIFVGPVIIIEKPFISFDLDNIILDDMCDYDNCEYNYRDKKDKVNVKIRQLKYLPSIENMALRGKNVKKRKK